MRCDNCDECRNLENGFAQVQRDERCVLRLASVVALFPVLALAGIVYGPFFQWNFPDRRCRLFFSILWVIVLASLICLVGLAGLLLAYRRKLNRLRQECLQFVITVLEARPGGPPIPALPSDV